MLFDKEMKMTPSLFFSSLQKINLAVDRCMSDLLYAKYSEGRNPCETTQFIKNIIPKTFTEKSWHELSLEKQERREKEELERKMSLQPGSAREYGFLSRDGPIALKHWPVELPELQISLQKKLHQLAAGSRPAIFDSFRRFDREGKRHITENDFAVGLRGLHFVISDEDAHKIFCSYDQDGDGCLSMEEFRSAFFPTGGSLPVRKLHRDIIPTGSAMLDRYSIRENNRHFEDDPLSPSTILGGDLKFPKILTDNGTGRRKKPRPPMDPKPDVDRDSMNAQKAYRDKLIKSNRHGVLLEASARVSGAVTVRQRRPPSPNMLVPEVSQLHSSSFFPGAKTQR